LTVVSTSALSATAVRRGRVDARRCVAAAPTALVISAFIVGAVRLHRDGLARILVDDGRVRVLGSAPPGPQTLAQIRDLLPEVVLLDTSAPGRLEHACGILDAAPEATIVALALADDEVVSCAEAGICGYVEPEASIGDLVATLESVVRGEVPCSPKGRIRIDAPGRDSGRWLRARAHPEATHGARARNPRVNGAGAVEQGDRAAAPDRGPDRKDPRPPHLREAGAEPAG